MLSFTRRKAKVYNYLPDTILKHNDIIDDREEAQEQELVKRDDIIDDREEIREETGRDAEAAALLPLYVLDAPLVPGSTHEMTVRHDDAGLLAMVDDLLARGGRRMVTTMGWSRPWAWGGHEHGHGVGMSMSTAWS